MAEGLTHTWDGLPVSPERPYAAGISVYRDRGGRREWLPLEGALARCKPAVVAQNLATSARSVTSSSSRP